MRVNDNSPHVALRWAMVPPGAPGRWEERLAKDRPGTEAAPPTFCPGPPVALGVKREVLAMPHRALRHPSASSSLPPPPPRLPPVPGCSALTPSLGPWLCFCLECSGRQLITSGTRPWLPAPSHPESLITRRNLKPSGSPYHPIELQETKATVRRTHCVSPGPGAAPGR